MPRLFERALQHYRRSLLEDVSEPSDGIFYVVPYPGSWKLHQLRYAGKEEAARIDHAQYWNLGVSQVLASFWARQLKEPPGKIWREIKHSCHGVPRGRITKTRTGEKFSFRIFWGEDFKTISKQEIENAFGLTGLNPKWQYDDHETCQVAQRDTICRAFKIKPTWDASGASIPDEDTSSTHFTDKLGLDDLDALFADN